LKSCVCVGKNSQENYEESAVSNIALAKAMRLESRQTIDSGDWEDFYWREDCSGVYGAHIFKWKLKIVTKM